MYKGSHFFVIRSFLFWTGVFLVRIVTSSGPSQLLLQETPVPVVEWVLAADHQSIFHPGKRDRRDNGPVESKKIKPVKTFVKVDEIAKARNELLLPCFAIQRRNRRWPILSNSLPSDLKQTKDVFYNVICWLEIQESLNFS